MAIFLAFKPKLAMFLGPVYALLQGVVLGAISHVYEAQWDGIVLQAIGITAAITVVMYLIFCTTGLIKVTDGAGKVIIGATLGVALFYFVSIILSLFGANVSYFESASLWSIGLSVVIAGVAAFNLMLDFDLVDRGAAAGVPEYMEWYAAFGLMVTVVWLYLEILRLLGKLNSQ